jgi:hypothetical protein
MIENTPPDAGLHKKLFFPHYIIGLAADRTRATCVARNGAIHSAIHDNLRLIFLI